MSHKLKVLFVVSDSTAHGGTEILAFNIMHRLMDMGVECYLLSRYMYYGDDARVLNMEQNDFDSYQSLLYNPIDKLRGHKKSDAFFKEVIRKVATKYEVDWIINHTYDLCAAIPNGEKWKTAQVFHWSIKGYVHAVLSDINKKGLFLRQLSKVSFLNSVRRWNAAIPAFTRLISLTNTAHQEITEAGGAVDISKLITIPDPLMLSHDNVSISTLNNNQVVYVGRLSQEKGVMRLLRIWEKVGRALPNYTLNVYGEGHMLDEMEQYIRNHHLSRIVFKGFKRDIADIYSDADLCLMTSETEGFGMVLIEAMYHGVPCVSFDCPISPKELIADAGVTIPCFEEEKYANEVVSLLRDKEKLHDLQLRAVKRARDFYIDKVINLWIEMLNTEDR